MIVCVPVTGEGPIDPRWGRADRVAIARVTEKEIVDWQEFDVGWSRLHDAGTEGSQHARVARFLRDHNVETVVANHMGGEMLHMLRQMGLTVHLGAMGDARQAVVAVAAGEPGTG